MARKTQKTKAQKNKQLWDRANTSYRSKWQSVSQKGYDFYLDEQLLIQLVFLLRLIQFLPH